MATKRKVKRKSSPKKKVSMATKRRKRRKSTGGVRRTRRRTLSAHPVRRTTRRRKKKGFLSDSGGNGIMASGKRGFGGAMGGGLFLATRLIDMPSWARILTGIVGTIGVGMYAPSVGAGIAGATSYMVGDTYFGSMLHDDFQDADYVDPDTLSDSGYMDDNGNAVLCDPDGIMYALSDDNELQAVGDMYSLNDGVGLQSVSMVPLTESPYDNMDY